MNLVREQREKRGWTMTELAKRTKWTLSKISRIESGHRLLKVTDISILAAAMGCTTWDLVPQLPEALTPATIEEG